MEEVKFPVDSEEKRHPRNQYQILAEAQSRMEIIRNAREWGDIIEKPCREGVWTPRYSIQEELFYEGWEILIFRFARK
jgi:hypothetical protein